MIKAGIVGGAGYAGVELLRILAGHPEVELTAVTSHAETGLKVSDMFPSLRRRVALRFVPLEDDAFTRCDVVFFATPNGIAMQQAARLLAAGARVVDLAADFRIRDIAEWEKWYGMAHVAPELVAEAVYGLPEVHRGQIRAARVLANPGCYPTAVQLGFLPLLEAGIVEHGHLIADAKSGVSGAGRRAEMSSLFSEAGDNFKAYGVAGHRHLPEIRQGLSRMAGGAEIGLVFVPHLTPLIRGIHATLYARLARDIDAKALQDLFESRFSGEAFVDVLPAGSHPETRSVRASNMCRIAVHRPQGGDTVVVLSVIDNLVKGAAGQAVQNMNIMFGKEETLGVDMIPVSP
ncbi:MAG: N-acetyl-gamma-glutamyl-phosphate reductase [Azoarcus sp.]|jgi:N-acetyl-gamma-glutamyl-phosphate reductase|nr:N-acetyl-gamma-glutamyl-phosphate reductase [Azoarcus sp.]